MLEFAISWEDIAGPSSQVIADEIFLSPEVREFRRFSEKSDVYSFGIFLMELLSGQEAAELTSSDSNQNMVEWVCASQPNRECVEEALGHVESNTLTRLVSDYFRHSEDATHLCLLLYRSVYRARALYAPLQQLLDFSTPLESISLNQSQCSRALDIFPSNPPRHSFPSPDSHNFSDSRRRFFPTSRTSSIAASTPSRSKIRRISPSHYYSTPFPPICLIGTAVGMVAAAAALTKAHALVAFVVAGPLCSSSSCCNSRMTSKEVAHVTQLDAAAKGTCVLKEDLATIDSLARRLHTEVEGHKDLIRLGLRGAQDKHPIQKVLKQLRKSLPNLLHLVNELDQHIRLCFNTVNRARSLLLQHIYTPCNVETHTDQT
ncbi:hypothetical protein M0R45_002168 [Rubus argutus]|uniref:Protein kinase domain-containing protein n=1 Tax=Rubus argutus TaxID=59490 RepID=A0AAW1VI54_RUBAR